MRLRRRLTAALIAYRAATGVLIIACLLIGWSVFERWPEWVLAAALITALAAGFAVISLGERAYPADDDSRL